MSSRFSKLFALMVLASLVSCKHLPGNMSSLPFFNKKSAEIMQEEDPLATGEEFGEEFDIVDDKNDAEAINEEIQEELEQVEVPDRVFFGLGQSSVSAEAKEQLNLQIEWLKSDPAIAVIIEGHADERGTREFNIALGEKRAIAVKKYLEKSGGIAPNRIKVISYGKERPAFIGSGEEIWSKNRRAVTVIEE